MTTYFMFVHTSEALDAVLGIGRLGQPEVHANDDEAIRAARPRGWTVCLASDSTSPTGYRKVWELDEEDQ